MAKGSFTFNMEWVFRRVKGIGDSKDLYLKLFLACFAFHSLRSDKVKGALYK
jgi:hypothetical protein